MTRRTMRCSVRLPAAISAAFFAGWAWAQTPPAAPAPAEAPKAEEGVPKARLARLAKGVNLAHWYWLAIGGDKGFADAAFFSKDDAAALKAAGITHVRLPVDPSKVFLGEAGGKLNSFIVKKLEATIDMLLEADLAVVIEVHALGTGVEKNYDKALRDPQNAHAQKLEKAFVANWTALAERLAAKDPERVFLEILNEPVFDRAAPRWAEIQASLAAAIRENAPKHTIIASGTEWSSIGGLLQLAPLPDKNVVYTFHFYEPHTFTHQGATWGSDNWKLLKEIPYPASPELVKPAMDKITDAGAKGELKWYGEQNWNAAKVEKLVGRAAEWGKKNGVPVWCGEFGVIAGAPKEARKAWLHDVRTACEKAGIGWCMWDYAGSFALTTGAKGERKVDPDVGGALGLK